MYTIIADEVSVTWSIVPRNPLIASVGHTNAPSCCRQAVGCGCEGYGRMGRIGADRKC